MRVTARDGDKGSPRPVRYGLLAEGNPYTVFFSIDQDKGDIKLMRPLLELAVVSRSHQPILLTVIAEEIVPAGQQNDPALTTTTATVALLLGQLGNSPPYFESPNYVTHIAENSPQGFALVFADPYITEVRDNDMGKRGVFSLALENNNGTFEITPTVGERQANFIIRVRDNRLLDFEVNEELRFKIVAKEVNPEQQPLSTSVDVIVYVTDVNDNPPVFVLSNYTATVPENVTAGTKLVKFECSDRDTGEAGLVKFTAVFGPKNGSLNLDWDTGLLTIAKDNHGFDREDSVSYHFFIEVRDMKGVGNKAVVPFTLILMDCNDNVPVFEKNPMEFILGPDGANFSQRAFIKATDADAEPPNNVVRYEIINGNYGNRYILVADTGELLVNLHNRAGRQSKETINELTVRAYDLGVPTMFSIGLARIYPAESGARMMTFVVPGNNLDPSTVHQLLTELTGARVVIHSVDKYQGGHLPGYPQNPGSDFSGDPLDRYIITATVLYTSSGTVVDLDTLQKRLANRTYMNSRPNGDHINFEKNPQPDVVYRTESNTLFWVLLLLILLILLLLILLLCCCFCDICPCYGFFSRFVRRKSAVQAANNVNYVNNAFERGQENKSVQAEWLRSAQRDAWSAESPRRQWYFNRRNSERRLLLLAERAHVPPPQPNIVYTREMTERRPVEPPLLPRNNNELIVEDVEGNEYRLLDPSKLSFRRSQADSNSLQRGPSRASDVHQQQRSQRPVENLVEGTVARPPTRDEEFIRDGNAEILRLVTRGRENEDDDDEPTINQPERPYTHEDEGKEVIMKKFIEDSNDQSNDVKVVERNVENNEQLLNRAMTMREQDLTTADINRLSIIQRDLLLTRFLVEENRRTRNNSIGDETQSLPGVVTMATQTDSHAGTQTEKTYFTKRRTKSDNDDSDPEENGRNRFKRNVRNRMMVDSAVEAFPMRPKEIKTPIMEENEADGMAVSIKNGAFTETKASLLRHAATRNKLGLEEIERNDSTHGSFKVRSMSDQDLSVVNKHREEVVRSLHVTPVKRMNITKNVLVEHVTHDELESPILTQSLPAPNRRARVASVPSKQLNKPVPIKRQASSEPMRSIQSSKDSSSLEREAAPRYMEWYNKKKDKENGDKKTNPASKGSTIQRRKPVLKLQKTKRPTYPKPVVDVDEEMFVPNIKDSEARHVLPDSLVQTEEKLRSRDSSQRHEEDGDSGIAVYMNGPLIGNLRHHSAMEKKSIFTIAYDDMETRKIRLDTASP